MLGPEFTVIGVQLPGRESRWTEPPASTVGQVVDAVIDEFIALVPAHRPLVVFGQSFGGLLGYEITRRLGDRRRWPTALVVAACRPPHMWVGAGRGLIDDDEELTRLLDLRALAKDELDEDSRELMLEVLRQDAHLSLTYTNPMAARTHCILEAWGGQRDEVVTAGQLDGWRDYAAGDFRLRQFPGGHYFCAEHVDTIIPTLAELFAQQPAQAAGAAAPPDRRRSTCG
jgi:surfactin synthase thioesterase subunit